jgi:hypothetical protein
LPIAWPGAIAVTLDKIDPIDRKFSQSLLGYRLDAVDRLVAEVVLDAASEDFTCNDATGVDTATGK